MNNFWARKLAAAQGQQPPQANTPASPPAASAARPWWDPTPAAPPPPPLEQPALAQDYQAPAAAKSARLTDTCPDCASGNYMRPPGSQAAMRCFDCGYPVVQTGSGAGGATTPGQPATPARQVHDGTSNFNPRQIIGRV
ncbi:hypothetical protein ACFWYW_24040 [Nonomuraea sp. NPDC059023]|uniref:hypothetical protein n=1 Tax=unclassified Nonomuraea TaxID=2593643 RepID=UPI003675EC0A